LSTPFRLLVPRAILDEMVAQARAELPNECCGLLAGRFDETPDGRRLGRVECRYPLVNAARSPTQYLSDADSMFAAVRDQRRRGVETLAVYHSHPTSAPVPSRTDLEQNYSGDVVNLIISLLADMPQIKGWWLSADGFREAEWVTHSH
jgi:proteasome lid subunit RPN8/RPN11